jgi:hypothetical protein
MGATDFLREVNGRTAEDAWHNAYQRSIYEDGHDVYNGGLAGKEGFVEIILPDEHKDDPVQYAQGLIDDGDERIDDKWGPTGIMKIAEDKYLEFGWAPT